MTRTGGSRPTVLIKVEGTVLRQALSRRLASEGYRPRPVKGASEVYRNLVSPDVEALIWMLEGTECNVLTLLDHLHDRESDVCVIVMGPELGAEQVSACLRGGAFDYLPMPLRPGRVEESLRQGLETRRSFREVRGLSQQLHTANAQLAQERDTLQRLNQRLVVLNQLSLALSGTHDVEAIARMVAERLPALLSADRLSIRWRELERAWTAEGRHTTGSQLKGDRGARGRQNVPQRYIEPPCTTRDTHAAPSRIHAIEVPLLSRNETVGRLQLERLQGQPFDPADRESLMAVGASLALSLANADAHRSLEQMAMKDGLTNLYNRRAFDQLLSHEVKAAARYRSSLCLLVADIDHFKTINDRFGHPVGDSLLKEVATLLAESLREVDVVARYGGEEFAMMLPRTDLHAGSVLANRIRERIERHVFMGDRATIRLTISIGVAGLRPGSFRAKEELVEAADRALYQAKAGGRNRVDLHEDIEPSVHADRVYARP